MSVLLGVLVGLFVVVLIVVLIGCLIVARQYLRHRHRDQEQRLALELRADPGQLAAPSSIQVFGDESDANANYPVRPGVRNRQHHFPQPRRYHQHERIAQQMQPNFLQVENIIPPPGTTISRQTQITITTQRTPSPAPPALHAPHVPHAPAPPRVQQQINAIQDETTARIGAGRVVRYQNNEDDKKEQQLNAKGSDVIETKASQENASEPEEDTVNLMVQWITREREKGGEYKSTADLYEVFWSTLNDAEKKEFGPEILNTTQKKTTIKFEDLLEISRDSKSEAMKTFASYLESTPQNWRRLVEKNDTKGMNEFLRKRFENLSNWQKRKWTKHFYRIYNRIDEKCREKSKKELKNVPFSAETYIGWDYEKKRLVYIAPNRNYYMNKLRCQDELYCETICHFRFDTFCEVRDRLQVRGIISADEYKLQMKMTVN